MTEDTALGVGMEDEEMFAIMDGMEEANREMADRVEAAAPICHFRKMFLDEADSSDYYIEKWWECSVCGHTKPI